MRPMRDFGLLLFLRDGTVPSVKFGWGTELGSGPGNEIQGESLPPGCPGYNPTSVRNKILATSLPLRHPGYDPDAITNRIPPTSLPPRRLGYNPANRILAISLPPRHPSRPGWHPAIDRNNNPVKMSCTGNVLSKTS
ncbi:hypothetical protein BT69DRAFT_1302777 [Atractiella rhizophila]|nr:hypothetical protein BT69DRAFT_1302777 [Atractiella rhizophila]